MNAYTLISQVPKRLSARNNQLSSEESTLVEGEESGKDQIGPLDDLINHKPAENHIDALLQQHILDDHELKSIVNQESEVIITQRNEDSSDEDQ